MPHTSAPTHHDCLCVVFTREEKWWQVLWPVSVGEADWQIGFRLGMVMGKARSGKQAEGARCRRHPRHRQQGAGVCASCLRDRLSHLSLSASLPSVVARGGEEEDERCYYGEDGASSCSEASTAYSSEGSSAASSGCASPGEPAFHDEMRRAARVSLLMRHEQVVGDADAVAVFLAQREQRRRTATTSFWAKLLHATRGGGKKEEEGCSLAARAKTLEERGAAASKWVLF